MNPYIKEVAKFHETFQAPILDAPQIPSKERCDLRVSLLQEELNELKEAIAEGNLTEIADALADLQYVLSGAILEFGLKDRFDDIFAEVQRSNMSKACSTMQEAVATLSHYKQKDGTEGRYEKVGDRWVVYRNSDDKVLKSVEYSPARISEMI